MDKYFTSNCDVFLSKNIYLVFDIVLNALVFVRYIYLKPNASYGFICMRTINTLLKSIFERRQVPFRATVNFAIRRV